MCWYVLYVEPVSRSKDYVLSRIKIGSVVCLYIPVFPSVPEMKGIYATGGSFFFFFSFFLGGYVPLVEFIYLVLLACHVELP